MYRYHGFAVLKSIRTGLLRPVSDTVTMTPHTRNALYKGLLLAACPVVMIACSSEDATPPPLSIGAATAVAHTAIRVEAENYSSASERWYITNSNSIPSVTTRP